jgi:protein arginine kinase activator
LCQRCQKNTATVHSTEIVDGVMTSVHLCDACAQSEGIAPSLTPQSLLSNLVGPTPEGADAGPAADLKCPHCGLTYGEFRQRGRLGCAEDYKLFHAGLVELLERIHGSSQHIGKIPDSEGDHLKLEREILEQKRELTRAIHREEYEQAAEIRDRIRELEERQSGGTD